MSIVDEMYVLNNGIQIPKLGFGTFLIEDGDPVRQSVLWALEAGYRHIDTAAVYKNEGGVGQAVRDCGIPREEIFVTSKISSQIKSFGESVEAIKVSLKTLDISYIDLMLIHWPQPFGEQDDTKRYYDENQAVWRAMEEAYESGSIKSIGVSNFMEDDLEHFLPNIRIQPMVNQIKAHIGSMDFKLINYCQERAILVEAYSPFGHGEIFDNDVVKKIAEDKGVTVAQLCLRYLLQKNLLPLPKSVHKDYIFSNIQLDFVLDKNTIASLDNINS
ncbi:MAG TPA: aldo/keto reductase [Clostridiaceae bacterium]|nr:aldo/keto reductase [Clostridiaceae bacterium]